MNRTLGIAGTFACAMLGATVHAAGTDAATTPAPTPTPASSASAPAATTAAPASANAPSTEARAMAETLFFTGRGLMEAGRYAEACQKFNESYRLDAAAGTLLNLAVCHEKIGKIASAWGEFRQALFDAKKAGREDRQKLAQDHIDVLEPELPYITIHVPTAVRVQGLEVVRNGSVLTQGGWDAELPVDPGKVEIITRAPGYKPKTMTVDIQKKQHLEVTVTALEKAPVPVVVVTEPGWSTERKIGLALIGVGVVGIGTGTYFGLQAMSAKSKSDDACPVFDGERRCTADGASEMNTAKRNAWIADIGIGVGLASAVVGTYMFVHGGQSTPEGSKPPATASTKPSVRVSFGAGPTGVSGFLVGAF